MPQRDRTFEVLLPCYLLRRFRSIRPPKMRDPTIEARRFGARTTRRRGWSADGPLERLAE